MCHKAHFYLLQSWPCWHIEVYQPMDAASSLCEGRSLEPHDGHAQSMQRSEGASEEWGNAGGWLEGWGISRDEGQEWEMWDPVDILDPNHVPQAGQSSFGRATFPGLWLWRWYRTEENH